MLLCYLLKYETLLIVENNNWEMETELWYQTPSLMYCCRWKKTLYSDSCFLALASVDCLLDKTLWDKCLNCLAIKLKLWLYECTLWYKAFGIDIFTSWIISVTKINLVPHQLQRYTGELFSHLKRCWPCIVYLSLWLSVIPLNLLFLITLYVTECPFK